MSDEFLISSEGNPHPPRARAILERHPEARDLFGRNPATALVGLAIVAAQTAVAIWLGGASHAGALTACLAAFAAAALFGAFCNHALYVVIHEATHDLVFRERALNKALIIVADLPNIIVGGIHFRRYHLMHHAHLGVHKMDADIPGEAEARFVGDSPWRKALWLAFFQLIQVSRIGRTTKVHLFEPWAMAAYAAAALYALGVFLAGGPVAILYLLLSFLMSTGLHPVGARWISEHYVLENGHETGSYYGPINYVALNVGHHNEHHDLPRVPWNRLPRLRRMAPEFYDTIAYHRSWSRLLWRFLTDRRYTLRSRVTRVEDIAATPSPSREAVAPANAVPAASR